MHCVRHMIIAMSTLFLHQYHIIQVHNKAIFQWYIMFRFCSKIYMNPGIRMHGWMFDGPMLDSTWMTTIKCDVNDILASWSENVEAKADYYNKFLVWFPIYHAFTINCMHYLILLHYTLYDALTGR